MELAHNNGNLINVDNTIQGVGNIGVNTLQLENQSGGLFDANVSGGTLVVDPRNATTMLNAGTMRASNGGTLNLTGNGGGDFDNTGGTIESLNNSVVSLTSSVSIAGGLLTTSGTGEIRVQAGNTASISGLTNSGIMRLEDNSNLDLSGAIVNSGVIQVDSGGNSTDLRIDNTVATLTGSGLISMNHNAARWVDEVGSPNGSLVNVNNTIEGIGNIGANTLQLENQVNGLIHANVSGGTLVIDPRNTTSLLNSGTLREQWGFSQFDGAGGGVFDNSGGIIEALAGSAVQLSFNASITAGTLQTSGTGVIQLVNGQSAIFADLTNLGLVRLEDNSNLDLFGTIDNQGTIRFESSGNNTDLRIDNTIVTLTGGGTLLMTQPQARILDETGANNGSLINGNNTIQGVGDIGANQLELSNQAGGLIDANVNLGTLMIDPRNGASMTNTGTMRATNGGILALTGTGLGNFVNAGGLIEAQNGSFVDLIVGADVSGGTLQSTGTGEVRVQSGQSAVIQDATISGVLRQLDNSNLNIIGTIHNTGTLHLDSVGNNTDLRIDNTTTLLTGGGTISMNHPQARILDEAGTGDGNLTNVDNTISGVGNIGANQLAILNQAAGLIDANVNMGSLAVDPRNGAAMTNLGTMRASGGGTLVLTGNGLGNFVNAGGLIEAQNNSFVDLILGADISGGTLQSTGTGEIRVTSGQSVSLTDVTIDGVLRQLDNSNLNIIGTIHNLGTINLDSTGNNTDLRIDNTTTTLTGGGTISMNLAQARILDEAGASNGNLTNMGNTISGLGNIGANQLVVTNQVGVIHANTVGTLTIDPRNDGGGIVTFLNDGTTRASNGGVLSFTGNGGGEFDGSGTFEALDQGALAFDSSAIVHNIDGGGNLVSGHWRAIDGGNGAVIRVLNNATANITQIGPNASVELRGSGSSFSVKASNTAIDSTLVANHGSFTLGDGRLFTTSGSFDNDGSLIVDGSSTLFDVVGTYSQTAGQTTLVNGGVIQSPTMLTVSGGLFAGNGDIIGDADFGSGSTVRPGLSAGIINDFGNVSIAGGIDIELGGVLVDGAVPVITQLNRGLNYLTTDYDQFHVLGDGDVVDGLVLDVSLINGYLPSVGDFFDILSGDTLTADLNQIVVNLPTGYQASSEIVNLFDPTTNSNRDGLRLTIITIPEPASLCLLLAMGSSLLWTRRRR